MVNIEKIREIMWHLMVINHKHRKCLEEELTSNNINLYPAQHTILMKLSCRPGINQKELAKMLQVSPATITISVKKLVKLGYIEKTNNDDDNRFNNLTITDKGKDIISKSIMLFDGLDEKMYEGFTDEECEIFNSYLKRLENNMNKHLGTADCEIL